MPEGVGYPAGGAPGEEKPEAGGNQNPFTETVGRISTDLTQIADALEQTGAQDAAAQMKGILQQYQEAIQSIAKGGGGAPKGMQKGPMPPGMVDSNAGTKGVPVGP